MLLWVVQDKANVEVATILSKSEATVKKHMEHILEKLVVESCGAAGLPAIEVLSHPSKF